MTERPAFYALTGGGWRDWWTLLHPPYTLWHLSYVTLGAAAAPHVDGGRLWKTLLAFFLAVGIGAHALDELHGRPLRTRIPSPVLAAAGTLSIGGAVAIGLTNLDVVGWIGLPFIAFGALVLVAYNTEAFGGAFHSDFWFALAWGAFPAFVAYWAQAGRFEPRSLLVSAACFFASAAQRALSTPVRALRRTTRAVTGTIARTDGSVEEIDRSTLAGPPETALRALSVALPLFAAAAVAVRLAP